MTEAPPAAHLVSTPRSHGAEPPADSRRGTSARPAHTDERGPQAAASEPVAPPAPSPAPQPGVVPDSRRAKSGSGARILRHPDPVHKGPAPERLHTSETRRAVEIGERAITGLPKTHQDDQVESPFLSASPSPKITIYEQAEDPSANNSRSAS